MNKAELIERLSTQLGSRRDATLAVESLVDVVIREVAAGGSVGITGFGTFERADRAPRTGRNPRTGESVPIAGTSTPRFRPGTYFKNVVTEPGQLPAEGLAGGRAPAGGTAPASPAAGPGRQNPAGRTSASARRVSARDTAAVETELKDSAGKTAKKSPQVGKKDKTGEDRATKGKKKDKGGDKKKDKKSRKK